MTNKIPLMIFDCNDNYDGNFDDTDYKNDQIIQF